MKKKSKKKIKKKVIKKVAKKGKFKHYAKKGIGGAKGMFAPIVAGIADNVIDSYSPIDGVGSTITGLFMHNEIVKNIGLYKVGYSIGAFLPLPRGGSTAGGLL